MMAQPEVQMSHLDGGEGGGVKITQNTGLLWGRAGGSMSRCRPQATPPSPPPPPFPRVLHQHLEGIGMGGGNGTPGSGGRNGEAASPTRPPLRPGPAPAQALRHKRLSLLSALTI